jgi:hypothetical protein
MFVQSSYVRKLIHINEFTMLGKQLGSYSEVHLFRVLSEKAETCLLPGQAAHLFSA